MLTKDNDKYWVSEQNRSIFCSYKAGILVGKAGHKQNN